MELLYFWQKGELDMQHIDPAFIRESLGSMGLSQTGGALTASVRDADEHFAGFSYSYAAPIDFGNDRTAKSWCQSLIMLIFC